MEGVEEKIVLACRAVAKRVTLPNGTTFTARSEKISRRNLPSNIRVKRTTKIGPRNERKRMIGPKNQRKRVTKKRAKFTPSTLLRGRLKRIKQYRELQHAQTGSGIASNLANLGSKLGSKAIHCHWKKIHRQRNQKYTIKHF